MLPDLVFRRSGVSGLRGATLGLGDLGFGFRTWGSGISGLRIWARDLGFGFQVQVGAAYDLQNEFGLLAFLPALHSRPL